MHAAAGEIIDIVKRYGYGGDAALFNLIDKVRGAFCDGMRIRRQRYGVAGTDAQLAFQQWDLIPPGYVAGQNFRTGEGCLQPREQSLEHSVTTPLSLVRRADLFEHPHAGGALVERFALAPLFSRFVHDFDG